MRMAGRQPNGMFNLRGNSEYFANNFLRNIKWRWWSYLRGPNQYEFKKYQIVDKKKTHLRARRLPPKATTFNLQAQLTQPPEPCLQKTCQHYKNNEQEKHNFYVDISLFVFTPWLVVGWEGGEGARIQQEDCQAPAMIVCNKMGVVNLTKGKMMGVDIWHRVNLKKVDMIYKKDWSLKVILKEGKIPRGVPQAQGSVARRLRGCGPGSTREDFSLVISFESKQKIYLFLHIFHNRIHNRLDRV